MEENVRAGRCVVAVDGPSGSGKSTVSRRLAAALGARYLDTGAMYRAVTWAVLRAGVDLADADAVAKVAGEVDLRIGTDPQGTPSTRRRRRGRRGDPRPRGDRRGLRGRRRAGGPRAARRPAAARSSPAAGRIVVEGRDIGTVVAPDADLKVYLTASADGPGPAAQRRGRHRRGGHRRRPGPPGPARLHPRGRPAARRPPTRWCWTPPSWASTRSSPGCASCCTERGVA